MALMHSKVQNKNETFMSAALEVPYPTFKKLDYYFE
jgi:hypothetical protein